MKTPTKETQFSPAEIAWAREYWKYLSDADLLTFWEHYTTGTGAGMYFQVSAETTYLDYLVFTAQESSYSKAHDI